MGQVVTTRGMQVPVPSAPSGGGRVPVPDYSVLGMGLGKLLGALFQKDEAEEAGKKQKAVTAGALEAGREDVVAQAEPGFTDALATSGAKESERGAAADLADVESKVAADTRRMEMTTAPDYQALLLDFYSLPVKMGAKLDAMGYAESLKNAFPAALFATIEAQQHSEAEERMVAEQDIDALAQDRIAGEVEASLKSRKVQRLDAANILDGGLVSGVYADTSRLAKLHFGGEKVSPSWAIKPEVPAGEQEFREPAVPLGPRGAQPPWATAPVGYPRPKDLFPGAPGAGGPAGVAAPSAAMAPDRSEEIWRSIVGSAVTVLPEKLEKLFLDMGMTPAGPNSVYESEPYKNLTPREGFKLYHTATTLLQTYLSLLQHKPETGEPDFPEGPLGAKMKAQWEASGLGKDPLGLADYTSEFNDVIIERLIAMRENLEHPYGNLQAKEDYELALLETARSEEALAGRPGAITRKNQMKSDASTAAFLAYMNFADMLDDPLVVRFRGMFPGAYAKAEANLPAGWEAIQEHASSLGVDISKFKPITVMDTPTMPEQRRPRLGDLFRTLPAGEDSFTLPETQRGFQGLILSRFKDAKYLSPGFQQDLAYAEEYLRTHPYIVGRDRSNLTRMALPNMDAVRKNSEERLRKPLQEAADKILEPTPQLPPAVTTPEQPARAMGAFQGAAQKAGAQPRPSAGLPKPAPPERPGLSPGG